MWREDHITEVAVFQYARPLVPASADAIDLDVLTPSHFLLGIVGSSLPSTLSSNFDHRKRYARAQAYSHAIWTRWFKEYVPTLNPDSQKDAAVVNAERKLRVERLLESCEKAKIKTFGRHGQPYSFADKALNPETLKIIWKAG